MREVIGVLSGVISTAALLCLCVFVAQMTVLKKVDWLYGAMYPARDNDRRGFEKAYCFLGVMGFLFCIGAGTYHLLWWMPSNWGWLESEAEWRELRTTLSFFSALLIGGPLVKLLFDCIELKTKQRWLVEDARILEFEADGYYSLVECGDNLTRLGILQDQFEAGRKKILEKCAGGVTSSQDQRLTKLVEMTTGRIEKLQSVEAARREAEERVQKEREQAAVQKKKEERAKLQKALSAAVIQRPLAKSVDCVSAGSEVLVEPAIAKQKWQALCDFARQLRELGEAAQIQTLLRAIPGVKPIADVTFKLVLNRNGSDLDGHYEAMSIRDELTGNLVDGLAFEQSLDGLLAAFFLRAALRRHLAWGHGLYGRDEEFIFTQERVIAILEYYGVTAGSAALQALTVPAGLRLCREEDGTLTLKCLTYLSTDTEGLYDCAVSVDGGCVLAVQVTELYKWRQWTTFH